MKEELKSKIMWQEDKNFGKVCTLTESALNGIINEATKELQEVIEKNEYYQNGYRAGSHDEMVKYDTKLFEAEGKVEIRDVRIADLERKLEQTEKDLADYQFNYPTIKELQEENERLKKKSNLEMLSFMKRNLIKI